MYELSGGEFRLTEFVINESALSSEEFKLFESQLNAIYEVKLTTSKVLDQCNLQIFDLSEGNGMDKNSYMLNVTSQKISINYTGKAGKMYGWLSLIQLIEQKSVNSWQLKNCTVVDYPAFEWRGLHLDVARHFFTIDEVKRFIDLMAFYKFNKFHWHLTDDQGWRIEMKKYPLLTSVGAYRDSTIVGHYNADPRKYEVKRTGGFYTQLQIKEVIAYAKARNVEIIPEIEMPGHARAALAAYPNLGCSQEWKPVPGLWGVFDEIFCSKPETINFLKDVLAEVVDLFPSEYIHIGGDEAPKTRWKVCASCQYNIKEHHLKDEHELQSYFIQQLDDFLTSKGKKLIGWDEILEGGLSKNAAVMSWRGEEGGIEAANQNHFVVMSPTTYCYFDYYQSGDKSEPIAIGGYLPLEKVYEFSAVPKGLLEDKHQYILGGQANLWTEYISTFEHVEYMVYPRALAMSEKLWSTNPPSYDQFLSVFRTYQEPILQKMKVNYARSIYATKLTIFRDRDGLAITVRGIDSLSKTNVILSDIETSSVLESKLIGWNDAIHLKRTHEGFEQKVQLQMIGKDNGIQTIQPFILHNGIGAKVDLVTLPHPKYGHNGGVTLVDGIKGKLPWKGDQWLGFNKTEVELIIDMPMKATLSDITLGFLDAKGSWIYLPKDLEIWGLNSKNEWEKMSKIDNPSANQKVELNTKVTKIKIIVHPINAIPEGAEGAGNLPWIFMDEVQLNFKP